jgi:prophage tail gpP-like protein
MLVAFQSWCKFGKTLDCGIIWSNMNINNHYLMQLAQ